MPTTGCGAAEYHPTPAEQMADRLGAYIAFKLYSIDDDVIREAAAMLRRMDRSTTREGGEGVLAAFSAWWSANKVGGGEWVKRLAFVSGWNAAIERATHAAQRAYNQGYRDSCEDNNTEPDMELARDGWHDWLHDCDALKLEVATTSSPDASPNSGEAANG